MTDRQSLVAGPTACASSRRRLRPSQIAAGVLAITLLGPVVSHSQEAATNGSSRDVQRLQAFTKKLRALYPQTRIDEVNPTETAGLYEVVMGPNIAYIDATGRYWYFGHRYDMVERKDLTAPRLADASRVDVSTLPIGLALKTVHGTGRRKLYVFADPNCGYCKQLERTLSNLSDTTVYTFLLPILSQDSVDKAAAIWCSGDRVRAWNAWMLDNQVPAAGASCSTSLDGVADVARKLRIEATPTLIAGDGRKAPGAMPLPDLTAWLDADSPSRQALVKTPVSTR